MIIIVSSNMKNYRNFFRYNTFWITYDIRCTSLFPCIMAMISNFTTLFIFQISILNFLLTNMIFFFAFLYDSCSSLVNNFIFLFLKLIIFIIFISLKNSKNLVTQSLSLYTSCLFSVLLNKDIVDMQYVRLLFS